MLSDIALEALHYFDRAALEVLQMHSRYLRDLVDRHARSLPLRSIHSVTATNGDVSVRLLEGHLMRLVPDDQGLEKLFHLLNNAFIHRLTLSFHQENLTLPNHLRAKANDLHCQIGALHIEGAAEATHFALVDFLGTYLRPKIYEASIWTGDFVEDYAMLFTHNALRGTVTLLVYELFGPPAPDCILPELFGVNVVETCAITTKVDPRPWISKFVEMFGTAERGTDIVRSVTLLHKRFGETSPWRDTVGPHEQPRHIDVPTPHSAFIKEWYRNQRIHHGTISIESNIAALFVFENAMSAKRLEVFVWTVTQEDEDEKTDLHYAYLLQVADASNSFA